MLPYLEFMAKVFVSYKRADKKAVFQIKDSLENAIGEKVWIDITGIESDAQFASVIMKAVEECEVFLFMYSKSHESITNYNNDWTVRELLYAQKLGKRIVFIDVDGTPVSPWFDFLFPVKQQVDAKNQEDFEKLCSNLRSWIDATSPSFIDSKATNQHPNYAKVRKWTAQWRYLIAAALALVTIVVFTALSLSNRHVDDEVIYKRYKNSVVLIMSSYHYRATDVISGEEIEFCLEDNGDLRRWEKSWGKVCTGSGFFISRSGMVATCLHTIEPWRFDTTMVHLQKYFDVIATTSSLKSGRVAKYKVEAVIDEIKIFPNGKYLGSADALEYIEIAADTTGKDIAILKQVSEAGLPKGNSHADLGKVHKEAEYNAGDHIFGMGFSIKALLRHVDEPLWPNRIVGEISYARGDIIECNASGRISVVSGSPMFNDRGHLAGMIYSKDVSESDSDSDFLHVMKAEHIVNLLEKEGINY